MSGVNKVIIVGHLGRDPDMKRTNAGKLVANLSVATSETWTDKNTGERKEKTEWHRIVVFHEGLAGVVEKYLKKGSKAYFEGKLQTRKWADQAGVEKYTTEIVLDGFNCNLTLLDAQRNGPPPASDPESYGTTRTRDTNAPSGRNSDMDDDIPF